MSFLSFRPCLLVALCLANAGYAIAAESASTPAESISTSAGTPAPTTAATGTENLSPLMRETRQYVAQVTAERNQFREANDTLRNRQGLLVFYGVVMTLLAAWLMIRQLRDVKKMARGGENTDRFSATSVSHPDTTVTLRKNATITVRNSATQQAEVVEKVQTRRAYARPAEASPRAPSAQTRGIARSTTPPLPAPIIAPEAEPRHSAGPASQQPTRGTGAHQQPTVRIEPRSDRGDPVEVAMKPGTTPVRRIPGPVAGA